MKKRLKIGRSNFKTIIEDNGYFVDKTLFIKEFFENASDIILMPRPKRFGKTLNLSMLEHFFDIQKSENINLFSDFEIFKKDEFCKKHQNKYPVINISLKDIKAVSWNKLFIHFKREIASLYKKHKFLLKSDKLDKSDIDNFKKILSREASEIDYKYSLIDLSEYLKKHFNKDVIILVDEYDTPIINAFKNTTKPIKSNDGKNTYYEEVINFMQTFLGKAYKGNDCLKKGLLTGVMRVGRESIFSEWNNFSVFDITSTYFADKFGFTEHETKKILSYFGLEKDIYKVEKWYDGYKFGNIDKIYNPWSIVNYISREKDGFKPYWVNTGDYSLIKERITEPNVKERIQDLIEGKPIKKYLNENFVFSDFENDGELIWTLLTYNGYLTQIEKSNYGNYKLKIPNKEVKIVFTDIIMTWLNTKVKIKRDLLISTCEDLINNRIIEFEKGFKQIIGDTISYFDTTQKKDKDSKEIIVSHEQIYHVYTLGLLAILSDDFIIKSNRESSGGRYDILLIPHDKSKNGIVIEIKKIDKRQNEKDKTFVKRINRKLKEALNQINENKYYKELIVSKIDIKNIIKIAIVFAGKEPFITKLKEL